MYRDDGANCRRRRPRDCLMVGRIVRWSLLPAGILRGVGSGSLRQPNWIPYEYLVSPQLHEDVERLLATVQLP